MTNIEIIEQALEELKLRDSLLISNNTHERSIAHRLAIYIENIVNRIYSKDCWEVDCEYNRSGIRHDPKVLHIKERAREIGKEIKTIEKTKVYPDIIVHKRGYQKGLIAIEVKRIGLDCKYDEIKLKEYKMQLGYETAVLVKYGVTGRGVNKKIETEIKEIK